MQAAHKPKTKRTKTYRAKPVAQFGGLPCLANRLAKATPLSGIQQTEVLTDYYAAMDAFMQGRAEFTHFEKLVYAVNVTRVLADMGFGEEYDETIYHGMAAVQRIKERHTKTQRWGLDGDGRRALHAMEDLHRAQLEIATKGEIDAAINEMWRRIRAGMQFSEKQPDTPRTT